MSEILIWILLGAFAGALMAALSRERRFTALEEVILGGLGGLAGGLLGRPVFADWPKPAGLGIPSLLVCALLAGLFLLTFRLIKQRQSDSAL